MRKELKKVIMDWMFENESRWQRVNSCRKDFREYIYNSEGQYLIGGEDVSDFISRADELIYSK